MYTINKYTSAVWPGVISLFTLLSPIVGGHWTNDGARVLYLVMSTVHCTVQGGTRAPDVPPVDECNIIGWSRPDRAATRRLCPHRGPPRLDWHRQQGGHPHPVLGGGLVRPRSSIHSTLDTRHNFIVPVYLPSSIIIACSQAVTGPHTAQTVP